MKIYVSGQPVEITEGSGPLELTPNKYGSNRQSKGKRKNDVGNVKEVKK